jgi:ABC-type histidine transport system ATPase subunit
MLELDDVHTFYGTSQVLFGLSMTVGTGEVVTLLGRNGMARPRRFGRSWGCRRRAPAPSGSTGP